MAFLSFNKSELVNLEYSLRREIIGANKTGAYCNTTVVGCNTRRYHGLLAVPVDAFGGEKHILLSGLDESIVVNHRQFNLGIHCYGDIYEPRGHKYIVDFTAAPVPTLTYKIGETTFRKSVILAPDSDQVMVKYELVSSPESCELIVKPFLAFRCIHRLTCENPDARTGYREIENGVSFNMYEGFPDLNLQLSKAAEFRYAPSWYKGITYTDEYRRGFDCREDLFVPGLFSLRLRKGESVIISGSTAVEDTKGLSRKFNSVVKKKGKITSNADLLKYNADLLICNRNDHKQIVAGLTWLGTGLLRETVVALPGLTLYAGAGAKEFEEILDNLIADNQERLSSRTTQVEAPLRIADALQQYIRFGAEPKRVWKKYGETMKGILESYLPGRRAEVALHPNGLLWAQKWRTALSWMNAYVNGVPVTERAGYQVETNAFWYDAICFALEMEASYEPRNSAFIERWSEVKRLIEENFERTFWVERGYLADYVDNSGQNTAVRPNQLFAIALEHSPVNDGYKSSIMQTISNELITSRGIRTLSPRNEAYRGVYEGSQIERDLAYHQGCAWIIPLDYYIAQAFSMIGPSYLKRAEYLVEGFYKDIYKHGVGAFSELYDGDPPHEPHGAISSACSTAALLRVEHLLNKYRTAAYGADEVSEVGPEGTAAGCAAPISETVKSETVKKGRNRK